MFGKEKVDEAAGSTRYKGEGDTEILQNKKKKKKIGIKSIMKVVKEKDRIGDRERKKV